MKTFVHLFLVMLFVSSCNSQTNSNIDHMTAKLWEEDINYVEGKIQKEFATFNPTVKELFSKNAEKLKQELSDLRNQEVAIKLGQLLASLKDGHTELSILQSTANLDRLPLVLYFFEDGLYIVGAQEKYKDLVGLQVLQIGDLPVTNAIERLKSVMTFDNDYEILHAGPSFLMLPDVLKFLGAIEVLSEIQITLIDDSNETFYQSIDSVSFEDYNSGAWIMYYELNGISNPLYKKHPSKNYWHEYLEHESTMYFYISRVNNQKGQPSLQKEIANLFKAIDKVKPDKLVIDLRRNSGGNYNKSRPLVEEIKKRPWLNKKGNIYVISGRTTFSAAMVTSIFLKKETNAILVGEPSRGHPNKCDNNEYMTLPNSQLSIEYTTKVAKHWSELGEATYVPIDKEIALRFTDYKTGIDPVMDYILQR